MQYLEIRFDRLTRVVTSLAFSVQMVLYMAIVLYVPALTLEAVTGLPRNVSIVLVGVVCVFYSLLGGIKAVIITDLFQVIDSLAIRSPPKKKPLCVNRAFRTVRI